MNMPAALYAEFPAYVTALTVAPHKRRGFYKVQHVPDAVVANCLLDRARQSEV